jgi:hypothetical protein
VTDPALVELSAQGRYLLAVRVRFARLVLLDAGREHDSRPALVPSDRVEHHDRRVAAYEKAVLVFGLTDHPACPVERSVAAAERFLAAHLDELDRAAQEFGGGAVGLCLEPA